MVWERLWKGHVAWNCGGLYKLPGAAVDNQQENSSLSSIAAILPMIKGAQEQIFPIKASDDTTAQLIPEDSLLRP